MRLSAPRGSCTVTSTDVAAATASEPRAPAGPARHRPPVLGFVARRLGAVIVTLLVVSFLIFLATNALPGNVAEAVLGRHGSPVLKAALDRKLNLDRPLLSRYGSWLAGILHGNLGQSAVQLAQGAAKAPVSSLIGTPLINSLV